MAFLPPGSPLPLLSLGHSSRRSGCPAVEAAVQVGPALGLGSGRVAISGSRAGSSISWIEVSPIVFCYVNEKESLKMHVLVCMYVCVYTRTCARMNTQTDKWDFIA